MLVATEQARATAWDAARAIDERAGEAHAAAVAAAIALPAFRFCAELSIQVHGGIGFTCEHDTHLYLRRAVALGALVGPDSARAEVATLCRLGAVRVPGIDLPHEAERVRTEVRQALVPLLGLPDEQRRTALLAEGYVTPHWPKPWGRGAAPLEQLLIEEELVGIVEPPDALSSWILATLIAAGSAEQQERWVRPTLARELSWCQLFSEPEAGSDLAGLRTRATRVDGGWRLSGSKIWTSGAHRADRGLCLARTAPDAPKHKGIGCFVVDMHAPGVHVRPLRDISGVHHFNEVYLDDVLVPDADLVGGPTDGWTVARATLLNERTSAAVTAGAPFGRGIRDVARLVEQLAPDDTAIREALGGLLAEQHMMQLLALRAAARSLADDATAIEGSVRKLVASEHDQRALGLALRVLGPAAAVDGAESAPWLFTYLANRGLTLGGGTSEIQRNIIAERILGLPRDHG